MDPHQPQPASHQQHQLQQPWLQQQYPVVGLLNLQGDQPGDQPGDPAISGSGTSATPAQSQFTRQLQRHFDRAQSRLVAD